MAISGTNHHHISAVVVNDGTTASIVTHFLCRRPGLAAILTTTEQSPTLSEGQNGSVSGDHDVRDAHRFEEVLHLKDRFNLGFGCV